MHFPNFLLMTVVATAGATILVQQAPPPIGVQLNIQDFQGNVLDLQALGSAALTPVQTLNRKAGDPAQTWIINQGANANLFTIVHGAAKTFLSFTTAATNVPALDAQVCSQPNIATNWKITPNANGRGYNIIESNSGMAVMSWLASNSTVVTPTTPVTLQRFDSNEPQQIFSFIRLSN